MKVILIIFLVISMIVPAFKDDIQKKLPILLNIYLYTIPILLAYILIFFAENVVIPENDILMTKKEPILTPSFFNIYSFVRDNH